MEGVGSLLHLGVRDIIHREGNKGKGEEKFIPPVELETDWAKKRLEMAVKAVGVESLGSVRGRERKASFDALARISHLGKRIQKAVSYEEGRSLFKDFSLLSTGKGVAVGLGGAELVRALAYLTESSPNRLVQFLSLGAGFLIGSTHLNSRNVDWEVATKVALRGVGLAAGAVLAEQAMKHLGLYISSQHMTTLPLEYSLAHILTYSAASGLGITRTGESLINLITGRRRRLHALTEYLYDNHITKVEESSREGSKKVPEEFQFITKLLQNNDGTISYSPTVALNTARKLKEAEEALIVAMMINPTRYHERWVKSKDGGIKKIDNLKVLGLILKAEEKLYALAEGNVFSDEMAEVGRILRGEDNYKAKAWLSRFKNFTLSTTLYGLMYSRYLLVDSDTLAGKAIRGVNKAVGKLMDTILGKRIYSSPQLDINLSHHEAPHSRIVPPEQTFDHLMRGDIPFEQAVRLMIKVPEGGYAIPIVFVDSNGHEVLRYSAAYLSDAPAPPDVIKMMETVEGSVYHSPWKFLSNLVLRNFWYLFEREVLHKETPLSGASDPAIQLVEEMTNFYNQFLLNPTHSSPLHDPSHYSFGYMLKLIVASVRGKVPHELDKYFDASKMVGDEPSATPLHLNDLPKGTLRDRLMRSVDLVCGKIESFLAAERLVKLYGADKILEVHSETVPMGGTVYGLPKAARYYFGENIDNLPLWKKVWLVGAIQSPTYYLSDKHVEEGARRALYVLQRMREEGLIKPSDSHYTQAINKLHEIISNPNPQDVFRPDHHNPNNTYTPNIPPGQRKFVERTLGVFKKNGPSGLRNEGMKFELGDRNIVVRLPEPSFPSPEKQPLFFDLHHHALLEAGSIHPHDVLNSFHPVEILNRNHHAIIELGKEKITVPELNGHPAVAYVIATNDHVLTEVDPTNLLTGRPTPPGSTIKPFIAAFIEWRKHAHNQNFDLWKTQIDARPFKLPSGLEVTNAAASLNIDDPENKLTLAQALAYSANVPFMREWGEILENDPNAFAELQGFLQENFGFYLTDEHGNKLTESTFYPVIGTDVYVPSLEQYAQAYARLANPSLVPNENVRKIVREIVKALKDYNLKSAPDPAGKNPWGGKALGLWYSLPPGSIAKTGTVPVGDSEINSDLLAAGFTHDANGRPVAVVVRVNKGDGTLHEFASQKALPIFHKILTNLHIVKVPQPAEKLTPPSHVVEFLNNVFTHHSTSTFSDYSLVGLQHGTPIVDEMGNRIAETGTHNLIVDKTGKVIIDHGKRLSEIAFVSSNGKVLTGYVPSDTLDSSIVFHQASETQVYELFSKIKPEIKGDINPTFIVVDGNERSPALKAMFEILSNRHMFAATYEDMHSIFRSLGLPDDKQVVVINGEMYKQYLTQKGGEAMIERILYHETEHIKQRMILEAALRNDPSLGVKTLDEIFWHGKNPTHAQKLLEALTDGRFNLNTTVSYQGEQIKELLSSRWGSPPTRLLKIYHNYLRLMGEADEGRINPDEAAELIKKLEELNSGSLTPLERKILGLENY